MLADLGQVGVDYIRRVIRGPAAHGGGWSRPCWSPASLPPAWLAGTALLALSKILDNMEIGHNVMHGQYRWTGDPATVGQVPSNGTPRARPTSGGTPTTSPTTPTPTSSGMDRDIGYGILRMSPDQPWRPYYLEQPGVRLPAHGAVPVRRRRARA